jgi:hypothetical protein
MTVEARLRQITQSVRRLYLAPSLAKQSKPADCRSMLRRR